MTADYKHRLGWLRFFPVARSLVDDNDRLRDELRAKDASLILRDKQHQSIVGGLMETIARKNGYAPIQPDTRQVTAQQQPRAIVSGPDVLAFRQSQADNAAKVATQEQEKERDRAFADEAREIINR